MEFNETVMTRQAGIAFILGVASLIAVFLSHLTLLAALVFGAVQWGGAIEKANIALFASCEGT